MLYLSHIQMAIVVNGLNGKHSAIHKFALESYTKRCRNNKTEYKFRFKPNRFQRKNGRLT